MLEKSRMIALGNLIQDIAGVPFVWQYQSKKNPADVFVSGRMVQNGNGFQPEVINTPTGKEIPDFGALQSLRRIEDYTLYLQATGENSLRILKTIKDSLYLKSYLTTLKGENVGLTYVKSSPIQNITEIRGGDYVERGSVDLRMRTFSTVSEEIYNIEKIQIQ